MVLEREREQALGDSRARRVGVFMLSGDGRVESLNPAGAELLTQDDEGRLAAALTDPDSLAAARAGVPSAARLQLAGSNGDSPRTLRLSLVSDGEDGMVGVVTPLPDQAPAPPPTHGRHWIDEVPAMIAYFDSHGRWLAANRELQERLGYDLSELQNKRLGDLIFEADRERLSVELTALREGRRTRGLELRLITRDDERLDVEVHAAEVHDETAQRSGFCAIVHEIARRKRMERDLEAYTHQLEQLYIQVELRTEELEQANEALRRARIQQLEAEELARLEAMKNALLDVAAHELRTPVTLLSSVLQFMQAHPDHPQQRALVDGGVRSARRLIDLLENALKLLGGDESQPARSFRHRSLKRLLQAAADDVQAFLNLRHQRLELAVDDDLPMVSMDGSMIRDVVINLVMNAIKFSPDGAVIHLTAARDGDDHVMFSVIDAGIGIAPEDLPHIFEGFFSTLDTSHHSSGSYEFNKRGPGLGLAIARKFVDLHYGSIDVDSVPGQGSRFTVRLPRKRPPGAEAGD